MYHEITNIDDIPLIEEYDEYVKDKLYDFITEVLPTRALIIAHESEVIPVDPYVCVREIEILGESMGGFNNKPTYESMDESGAVTQVFLWSIPYEIKAHMGNAKSDLSKLWTRLKNPTIYYNYFGKYSVIDCNPTSGVRNANTPTDDQKWELGAVLNVTINIAVKYVEDEGLGSIESINFTTTTKDSTDEVLIEDTGSSES